jgi:hypothetical protein
MSTFEKVWKLFFLNTKPTTTLGAFLKPIFVSDVIAFADSIIKNSLAPIIYKHCTYYTKKEQESFMKLLGKKKYFGIKKLSRKSMK